MHPLVPLFLRNCEILRNTAGTIGEGGGMAIFERATTSSVWVRNTHFSANTAEEVQSFFVANFPGVITSDDRHIELVNCLFSDHHTNDPSTVAAAAQDAEFILTNCTFANNDCSATALLGDAKMTLQNTILQSNDFPDFFIADGNASNIEVESLGGNLVGSSSLDAYLHSTDQSNADPLFEAGSFQLSQNSPAVDAALMPDNLPDFDLAGNDRLQGGCLDIGALESPHDAGTACLTGAREVLADPSTIFVYPNPVSASANISIENDWKGELNFRIVNALGQVVFSAEAVKQGRTAVMKFAASDLPEGIYRVLVSNGEAVAVSSFVKM